MSLRNPFRFVVVLAACLLTASCSRTTSLEPFPLSTDPMVFTETFGDHVIFQAFGGSKLDALSLDTSDAHSGTTSIKVSVPASGSYAGGALTTSRPRNLTGYNAISFWAKASRAVPLEVAGLGNDNTGNSIYTAQRGGIALTTAWTQYFVAIPNPAKLTSEGGMFFFAEGPQGGTALTFWIDDIQFVNLASITNPRPAMNTQTLNGTVGAPLTIANTRTVFAVSGLDQTVTHMPAYFDYTSSDPSIVKISKGVLQLLAGGTATVTAKLAGVAAAGTLTINAVQPPTVAAPTPTLPASSVISLFSDPYPSVPVDTWSASWDLADSATVRIAGNLTKRYTNLSYAGIEFTSHEINATGMSAIHLDVLGVTGSVFKVKLVDFGPNGVFGGADDSETELTFGAASTPPYTSGAWVSLDIPLANFTALTARGHLAQLILSSDSKTVYVDNIYFHQ